MIVHFKKDNQGNFTLHAVRADGTETYQKYNNQVFQIEHDLMHFVVETTRGFKNAFYGILASGKDIAWFAEADKKDPQNNKKPRVGTEAMQAEILAGQIQGLRDDEEFFKFIPQVFEDLEVPMPDLSKEQLRSIRGKVAELLREWQESKTGISLEFMA